MVVWLFCLIWIEFDVAFVAWEGGAYNTRAFPLTAIGAVT